ncbi:MAG: hypothetical protein JST00_31930 [Deltaproteobacteria bacterium]|nr:hypothetical protein [Deltaproteobacteria bacterium]
MARRAAPFAFLFAPALVAGLIGSLAGCPNDDPVTPGEDAGTDAVDIDVGPSPCPTGYLGDPSKEPEIELRALTVDGKDVPLLPGNDLAIILPPQGGRVAFVGVRVRNMDGCAVKIVGAMRDPTSGLVTLDGRTVNLTREDDGWGTTGRGANITNIDDSLAIADYSNIPLCPNSWSKQDVFDTPHDIEVVVTDRRKRTVRKTVSIVPRCAQPGAREAACRCLCRNGYVLGDLCGEDAGVEAGAQ